MEKKKTSDTGIRVEIIEGENEAVAVDALVSDFLHGKTNAALRDLHEPHTDERDAAENQA